MYYIDQETLVVDKPDKLLINQMPTLENEKLTVKEGGTIGPYNCSADCNPPCEVKWRYNDTAGKIKDILPHSKAALSLQNVNRNMSEFRCVAIYDKDYREKYIIELNVECKFHFIE